MPTNLSPKSQTSAVILTSTGSADLVSDALPFGIYTGSVAFLSGASDQVAYVYKKLGGDVVDIELTPANVYAAYEEAVLEYSYIFNLHQGKNVLSDALGDLTGTFNHKGNLTSGPLSASLRYPRFEANYTNKIGDGLATMAGVGGTNTIYSASFTTKQNQQDYDLQTIISSSSASGQNDNGDDIDYSGKVTDKRIIIDKVYYRSPIAMWRFYGYYGGVGVVGNSSTYGQYADDSTHEIVPTWQNKLQAIMYADSLYTRVSHYTGIEGINNLNTLPFDNLPYQNINAIGKQWIRKYALALSKEMLGQIRGKFTTIPIPGESVTLNHSELLSQAKEEQTQLKDKLMEILKEIEYPELAKKDQEKVAAAEETLRRSPLPIFVG